MACNVYDTVSPRSDHRDTVCSRHQKHPSVMGQDSPFMAPSLHCASIDLETQLKSLNHHRRSFQFCPCLFTFSIPSQNQLDHQTQSPWTNPGIPIWLLIATDPPGYRSYPRCFPLPLSIPLAQRSPSPNCLTITTQTLYI